MVRLRVILFTIIAMLAFAANSVFCRLALSQGAIDPASFTFIRLASGATVLGLVQAVLGRRRPVERSWLMAFALFGYAAAFSLAYMSLPAGAGALLLFGAVQATMILTDIVRGTRLTIPQLLGFMFAILGLTLLLAPGSSAPPLLGSLLMIIAGIAWGAYSLLGRRADDPLAVTANNFLMSLPMALPLLGASSVLDHRVNITLDGSLYALLSGALASGLGYTIWYAALPNLLPVQSASVQLCVPVITAFFGVVTLGEPLTLRLMLSSVAILGGIAVVVLAPQISKSDG
jgi:drug/metabolite transporter (DMT)-like permease